MIGDIIKRARKGKSITTTQLGKMIGVAQSMISRYESGKTIPPKQVLKKISKILEIDLPESDEVGQKKSTEGFNQKEFEAKLSRAKNLGVKEKTLLLNMTEILLQVHDAQIMLSNWTAKK